jgi:predicted transposase YdaD
MRVPPERRAELHAEALKRIARSGDNDWRRYLLAECVEAYANLDEAQRQRLEALLTSEKYQEVRPFMITTYERGKIEGRIEGRVEGRRETALLQLEAKFGPLSPEVKQRVEALTSEQLGQVLLNIVKAQSLKELHLEG